MNDFYRWLKMALCILWSPLGLLSLLIFCLADADTWDEFKGKWTWGTSHMFKVFSK